jgi:hypothetical protein
MVVAAVTYFSFHRPTPAIRKSPIRSEASKEVAEVAPDSTAVVSRNDAARLKTVLAVFSTPISFYGKVVDQNGEPVPGAKVYYGAADKYFGNSSKYSGISDANGLFSITGIRGAGLFVGVAKEGYAGTKRSGDSFGYGIPRGSAPPTAENPAIFVLRKKAEGEPLIVLKHRSYEIPKNGVPVEIGLSSGKKVRAGEGNVRVESWVDDKDPSRRQFNWKCRISVPDGGLLERKDDSLFEAPADGYQPQDEMGESARDERWSGSRSKDYFVKTGSGYGLVRFEMLADRRNNAFVIEAYLNPSGSRNVEYDPSKQLNR